MGTRKNPKARRAPTRKRGIQTVEEILEAGTQVLERVGPADLSVAKIAERSGFAESTVYQYFKDADDVLKAVFTRQLDKDLEAFDAWALSLRDQPLEVYLRKTVRALVRRHRTLAEIPDFDRTHIAKYGLATFNRRAHERMLRILDRELDAHQDELRVPRKYAHIMQTAAIRGAVHGIMTAYRDDLIHDERLADELADVCIRYLTRVNDGAG